MEGFALCDAVHIKCAETAHLGDGKRINSCSGLCGGQGWAANGHKGTFWFGVMKMFENH